MEGPGQHARRPFPQVRDHVLPFAGSIAEADERLAARIDRGVLEGLAAAIPDDWLPPEAGLPDAEAHRRAYVDYLSARLESPRPFVEEADRVRAA